MSTVTPSAPPPPSPANPPLVRALGAWAAFLYVGLSAAYVTAVIASFATVGLRLPPPEFVQSVAAWVSLLGAQLMLVVQVALRDTAPPARRALADLGVLFAVLFSASTSINRFVQLVVLPKVSEPAQAPVAGLIHPYGPTSIMFAIEMLGWGFFLGLSTLFAGWSRPSAGVDRWVRALLWSSAALCLAFTAGILTGQPVLGMLGFPAWGILLPAAIGLAGLRLRAPVKGDQLVVRVAGV